MRKPRGLFDDGQLDALAAAALEAKRYQLLGRLARIADYKNRDDFKRGDCVKDPCTCTVTLCGRCVFANQLGNIMFGIVAFDLDLIGPAREYGRGNPIWIARLGGAHGRASPWTDPGQGYRETAFDVGILFARLGGRDDLCDLLDVHYGQPIHKGASDCKPAKEVYDGSHTDITGHKPKVDPSGN